LSTVSNPPEISPETAAAQHVMQLATGYIASTATYLAVKLRIADRLAAAPQTTADLAKEANVNEDALYRVLRTLTSLGVFEETAPRTFGNNLPSSMLRSGAQGSLYDMALWMSDPFHFQVYADALYSVETGKPAVEKTFGMPVFEYFPRNPQESEIFNNAMTMFSGMVIPAVLEVYDFSGIGTLVDVAGGHGRVLTSILEKYPAMRGVLFDLEHVVAGAYPGIDRLGLANRCTTATGDFFKAVPQGGDAYIMKHIIHDWNDAEAITILKNIRSAMNPGGRVILLESVIAPGSQPDFGKIIDLEMLLMPGGRERTEQEFRVLFERAGFTLTRIVPTKSPLSVVEAR
jgi:O-methyltransferase domain/Dimerisation domain